MLQGVPLRISVGFLTFWNLWGFQRMQGVPLRISLYFRAFCKACPLGFQCISWHFARGTPQDVGGFPLILQGVPRIISLDFPSLLARDIPKLFNGFPHILQGVPPLGFQWNSWHFAGEVPLRISVDVVAFCKVYSLRISVDFLTFCTVCTLRISAHFLTFARGTPKDFSGCRGYLLGFHGCPYMLQGVPLRFSVQFLTFC